MSHVITDEGDALYLDDEVSMVPDTSIDGGRDIPTSLERRRPASVALPSIHDELVAARAAYEAALDHLDATIRKARAMGVTL